MLENLKNKTLLIVGMGKSGQSVARFCLKHDIRFVAYDDKLTESTDYKIYSHVDQIFGIDGNVVHSIDLVIQSPGINGQIHPVIRCSKSKKIPILSDIDLFNQCRDHSIPCIGITGTNGKSTTTSLVAHILNDHLQKENSEKYAWVGGNIGVPVLDLLIQENQNEVAFYVLELSSYQLDIAQQIALDIALFLNITADHIDYHGTFDAYQLAKEKIFRAAKISIKPADLVVTSDIRILQDKCHLRGDHNLQNMQAAYLICKYLGVSLDTIYEAITSFKGIEHRQEIVFENEKCIVINDSKATNADATETALKAFESYPIFLILGGVAKDGGILSLKSYLEKVEKIYLIGQAQNLFLAQLQTMGIEKEKIETCETLEKAVSVSLSDIQKCGDNSSKSILLFSPACASFDQFLNFEDRGLRFKRLLDCYCSGCEPR
ncbi:MAG: hypothetical protein C0432_03555 [Candidatus Puniceispirillum sp.]|nr:hypothetical protein [Candidatus Pelagibacter sp.]MBA4283350.1 hypothetical protein [Candidatus Puniceispirillum sp.]